MKFKKKSALIFPTGLNLLEKKTQKLIQGIFRISDLIKIFLKQISGLVGIKENQNFEKSKRYNTRAYKAI